MLDRLRGHRDLPADPAIAESIGKQGWVSHHKGQHGIIYTQLVEGTPESIEIDGERLMHSRHVLYIPSEAQWAAKMPAWARDDREIILTRVRETFPEPEYEYEYEYD